MNRRMIPGEPTAAGAALAGRLGCGCRRDLGRRADRQARGRQDRRLQDLAGRVVASQGPVRQADRQPRLPQDRPRAVRDRGVEFVNQFFKDKAQDSAYLKDLKTRANDVGVTCVLIMIDGEGDLERQGPGQARQGRREPQEVGRRRRGARAATPSGSTPASNYSPTDVDGRRRSLRQADRVRREEPDQDHLREPRRPVEQPRRPDRPDEGREQADRSARSPTSATSPRTARQVHDRRLRRDRPDDALRQGGLGQELRLRRLRAGRPSSTTPGS